MDPKEWIIEIIQISRYYSTMFSTNIDEQFALSDSLLKEHTFTHENIYILSVLREKAIGFTAQFSRDS